MLTACDSWLLKYETRQYYLYALHAWKENGGEWGRVGKKGRSENEKAAVGIEECMHAGYLIMFLVDLI